MRDYVDDNRQAWEDAFEHRTPGWGEDNIRRLLTETLSFFEPEVRDELEAMDLRGKRVAQFCCNNGRELLSLVKWGAGYGAGFDIAGNILEQARDNAHRAGIFNCDFVQGDLLAIPDTWKDQFDFIFTTVGALTWFHDLGPVFKKAADCLKAGGMLLINDIHPLMNLLPTPDEEPYDPNLPGKITYPYFRDEPWIENDGMFYISGKYASKTFTSFSHTLEHIFTNLLKNGFTLTKFREFDYDVGLTDVYNGMKLPLSYLLTARLEKKPD